MLFFSRRESILALSFQTDQRQCKKNMYMYENTKSMILQGEYIVITSLDDFYMNLWRVFFNHGEWFNLILHTIVRKQLWFPQDQ